MQYRNMSFPELYRQLEKARYEWGEAVDALKDPTQAREWKRWGAKRRNALARFRAIEAELKRR